jgi:hypothetical protein
MKLIQELTRIDEGAVKDAIMDLIDRAMDMVDVYDMTYEKAISAIADKVMEIDAKKIAQDKDMLVHMIESIYSKEDHADVVKEDEEPIEPKVIAKADEFQVVLDSDEQVHLIDGEENVRVSMPLVIWKQLVRS